MALPDASHALTVAKPAPARAAAVPSLGTLLSALRRRWLLALTLGVLAAGGVAAAVWYLLPPPKHEAYSIIHLSAAKPSIVDTHAGNRSEFGVFQQSQKAIIVSQTVLKAAINFQKSERNFQKPDRPRIADLPLVRQNLDNAVPWLQKELKIDFKIGPEFMRVSMRGDDPGQLQKIVKGVTDAYLDEVVVKERRLRQAREDSIKTIRTRYMGFVDRKQGLIREAQLRVGASNKEILTSNQKVLTEIGGLLRKEETSLKSELTHIKVEIAGLTSRKKKQEPSEVPAHAVQAELRKHPKILDLVRRKDTYERDFALLASGATQGRNEPSLQWMPREVERLEATIKSETERLEGEIRKQLAERAGEAAEARLAELKVKEEKLKELATEIGNNKKQNEDKLAEYTKEGVQIAKLEDDLAFEKQFIEKLDARLNSLEVEADAPPRITLFEDAATTQDDPTRRQVKFAGMGGFVALFAVLGLVGWLEYRQRRIQSPQEVVEDAGLALIGTIPALSGPGSLVPADSAVGGYHRSQSLLTECVDSTRTRLLHAAAADQVRVVMVTSAVPLEGKTSVSSHLAVSLARAGHRTLLLDGDIRLPAVHRLFDLRETPGFSELLRGDAELLDVIQPTRVANLWAVSGGVSDAATIQMLARPRLANLLGALREQFDYIVVDSAPVLPVVDSLLLGQTVDAVIFSVLRDVSQMAPLQKAACQKLSAINVRVLGAVLSGVDLGTVFGRWSYYTTRRPAGEPDLDMTSLQGTA